MPIEWREPTRQLHLHNASVSYLMRAHETGRLVHLYFGDGNETAWMVVAEDRRSAVVGWYRALARALPGPSLLPLRGLDQGARYRVGMWPATDDALARANSLERGGDELMSVGLFLDDHAWEAQARGDFQSRILELEAVS